MSSSDPNTVPISDGEHGSSQINTYDAKPGYINPPIEQLRPPEGAPNVLVILIDDAGFGSSSAFGAVPDTERGAARRWRVEI